MNVNSPFTLHHQLKREFYEKIANKEWLPGQLIPSEKELCEEYGVSRITVREALRELVQANYLVRKQGKGTFVAAPTVEFTLLADKIIRLNKLAQRLTHCGVYALQCI